jgi:hypothetical protein
MEMTGVCRVVRVAGLLLAITVPAVAQDAPETSVFDAMVGKWVGEGTLMGRPARFTADWSARDDGFYVLSFTNAFAGSDGQVTPVLSAVATYLPRGQEATGVWLDTRPQRIELSSVLSETSIVTTWVAPDERGRTEYRLEPDGSLRVLDFVETDGQMHPFGEALYTRAGRN